MKPMVDWIIDSIRNGECVSFKPVERVWCFKYSESIVNSCLTVTDEQLEAMDNCDCVKHRVVYKHSDYWVFPRWTVKYFYELEELKKSRRWELTPYQDYWFKHAGTLEIKIVGKKWSKADLSTHEKEMRQDLEYIEFQRNQNQSK